jgi:hypothetical protein
MNLDLDDDEIELVRTVLRHAIEAIQFPLSPEVKALDALLVKIDAQAEQPEPAAYKRPRR